MGEAAEKTRSDRKAVQREPWAIARKCQRCPAMAAKVRVKNLSRLAIRRPLVGSEAFPPVEKFPNRERVVVSLEFDVR